MARPRQQLLNVTRDVFAILLFMGSAHAVQAQIAQVTITVVDARTQRSLPGVDVRIVGTRGVIFTDPSGRLVLGRVPAGGLTLELRKLGYAPLRYQLRPDEANIRLRLTTRAIRLGNSVARVSARAVVTARAVQALERQRGVEALARAQRSSPALDEVVVTGTVGGTEKRALGNSVARISASNVVEATSINEMQQLLNGRVAGLVEVPSSGTVGTGGLTRIRGIAAVGLPNRPVLYVDGVRVDNSERVGPSINNGRQVSRINDLNPEDIESIEVIKGPAASALYGPEASRGVIQIITHRGTVGPARFDALVKQGISLFMDPANRLNYVYGRTPGTGALDSVNLVLQDEQRGTPIFQTGHLQSYGARMRGGTESLRYYASTDFDRDVGVLSYNWRNRLSLRSNLEFVPTEKLRLLASVGFTRSKTRFAGAGNSFDIIAQINGGSPLSTATRGYLRAPPETLALVESFEELNRVLGSLRIQHTPNAWFNQQLIIGGDLGDANSSLFFPADQLGRNGPFGTLSEGDATLDQRKAAYTTLDYSVNAQLHAGTGMQLTTSLGAQYYGKNFKTRNLTGHGFPVNGSTDLSAAASRNETEESFDNKTIGLYAQEQIGLYDRLYLTGAIRADDQNASSANVEFATYPRLSLSWVVVEKPVVPVISALQLRAAFGAAGQHPDVYADRTYPPGQNSSTVIDNPDLKRERREELEVGFDAAFLRDRLTVSYSHYEQRNRDAIVSQTVASGGSTNYQLINIGEVRNWGDELDVDARVFQHSAFALSFGITLSQNQNVVERMNSPLAFSIGQGQWIATGFPVGSYFGLRLLSAAVDASGRPINVMCDGGPANNHQPMPCATAPEVYLGQPVPRWEGALHAATTILGKLRLYALADFKRGHMQYDGNAAGALESASPSARLAVLGTDPLLQACNLAIPNASFVTVPNLCRAQRRAGFARLREASVSYALPQYWTSSLRISRATLTVSGRNLADLWTEQREIFGVKLLDPETRQGDETGELSNFVRFAIPQRTQILTTLRVTF